MSKPETSIFPIEHGKLTTDLDAAGLQILNLDTSNLPGGSGNDTGTTTAILKGDGDHGFADAVADVDYASVGSVAGLETSTDHDADLAIVTADITTLETDLATLTTVVGNKADASNVSDALALKENITDHDADITAVENDIADVAADLATLTTAVGNKADSASVSAALAGKEPLLPTTVNDSYVLARHNAGGTDQWFFVDPVTLGSTNATYGDGATHSNTTFNSTLAVFTTNDTGKTIVCAGNIPADTTITFVNATTVTLSNAATTTASGLTFVILNRFLPSGSSGGTVTSVALNNNATALLSIPAVANSTTTPTITINSATPAAHTFYGNNSGVAATPIFMDALQARNNLGGTVVGQAIFQASSIGVISYVRVNADNTATMRNIADTKSDLGVENALTFSAPLARVTNTVTIPQATSLANGYLSSSDWAIFNAKIGTGTKIITTAPLQIGGVSGGAGLDLSTTRTIAMPVSTGNADGSSQVDGYLSGADHTLFANKPPNSRTIATTSPMMINPTAGGAVAVGATGDLSANRTIAIQRASTTQDGYLAASDFFGFNSGSNAAVIISSGPATISSTASPRINRLLIPSALNARLDITLPLAASYSQVLQFPNIEIVDISSGGHSANGFGIRLIRQGSDLINGSTSSLDLPLNIGYVRINSDGTLRWTTTRYYVQNLANPTNIAGTATFNTSALTAARTIYVPNSASTFVVPTDLAPVAGVIKDINSDGTATKVVLSSGNVSSRTYPVGTAGFTITSPVTVPAPDTGDPPYDTVAIYGNVGASLQINLPDTNFYSEGQDITIVDFSGSVGTAHPVTITSTNGTNTFNKVGLSIAFDEPNGKRLLTSDGTSNWSIPSQKSTINQGFQVLTLSGGAYTLNPDPAVSGAHKAYIALQTGVNNLSIPSPFDGMQVILILVQPASVGAGTLNLPVGSATSGTGAGLVTLSGIGKTDLLTGVYLSSASTWMWQQPTLDYTKAALPAAPTALATGTITASTIPLTWTDNATNETGFDIQRSTPDSGITNPFATIFTAAANATGYTDTGLSASTPYYYRVRAQNTGGSSAFTSVVSGTTTSACSTAGDTYGTWVATGVFIAPANSAAQKFIAAANFTPTTGKTSPCRITAAIYKQGTPIGDLTAYIYAYASVGGPPAVTPLYTSSTTITAGAITNTDQTSALNTPLQFSFSGVTLSTSSVYYVVIGCSAIAPLNASTNCYRWVDNSNQTAPFLAYKSADGATWVSTTFNIKPFFKTFI